MSWFQQGYEDGFNVSWVIPAVACAVLFAVVVLIAMFSPAGTLPEPHQIKCWSAPAPLNCRPTTTTPVTVPR